MKKQDIEDIVSFIEREISDYDINYDFEIEDNVMEACFKGQFTSNEEVYMTFRCVSGNVEFYALCESYIQAETRNFWIDFMFKLNDKQ